MIKTEIGEEARAAQNRLLVAGGVGNEFYDEQARIRESWGVGKPVPKKLVVDDGAVGGRGHKIPGEESSPFFNTSSMEGV